MLSEALDCRHCNLFYHDLNFIISTSFLQIPNAIKCLTLFTHLSANISKCPFTYKNERLLSCEALVTKLMFTMIENQNNSECFCNAPAEKITVVYHHEPSHPQIQWGT